MNVTEKAKASSAPPPSDTHAAADKAKTASSPTAVNVDDINKRLEASAKELNKGRTPDVAAAKDASNNDATKDRITVEAHRRAMENGVVKA